MCKHCGWRLFKKRTQKPCTYPCVVPAAVAACVGGACMLVLGGSTDLRLYCCLNPAFIKTGSESARIDLKNYFLQSHPESNVIPPLSARRPSPTRLGGHFLNSSVVAYF